MSPDGARRTAARATVRGMTTPTFPIPISYVADEMGSGRPARRLQRDARHDQLLRVLPGAYAERSAWTALTPEQRHLLQIAATLRRRPDDPVLFGESAAVLLGLPTVRPLPSWVHVSATDRTPPASSSTVRWFRGTLQDEDVTRVHGVRVTDLRRTAVDLARSRSFPAAVAAVDAALRPAVLTLPWRFVDGQVHPAEPTRLDGVGRGTLAQLAATSGRGVRTAREAIEFGDPLAASPGESFSRAHIHLLGFPPPVLQRRFVDPDGSIAVVDFDWPDHGVSGEFDGFVKYSADEYLRGALPSDVLWREKERERRLKRHHHREVARWVWSDLQGGAIGLRDELIAAGLPCRRR